MFQNILPGDDSLWYISPIVYFISVFVMLHTSFTIIPLYVLPDPPKFPVNS